jgi:hypothetical protein
LETKIILPQKEACPQPRHLLILDDGSTAAAQTGSRQRLQAAFRAWRFLKL